MKAAHFAMGLTAVATLALTACGGGGTTGGTTPPVSAPGNPSGTIPGPSSVNASTTYTVFQGQANGTTLLEVDPYGVTPQTLTNVQAVPGAVVQYPDGSVQIADTLGNFDASQATYANAANVADVQANPQDEPAVIVWGSGSGASAPVEAYVSIFSPQNTPVTAGASRFGSTPGTELSSVAVLPRGYALYDGEQRVYRAVAKDSDGKLINLNGSGYTVTWSLTLPKGCAGSAAGSIAASSSDPTRAIYKAPKSGTFNSGCQDLVVATVTAGTVTTSGSGNAFYYDPATAATLKGTLTNASNGTVANGIVDLYGGGREFWHGKLFAITDANGNFTRLVPANRTLYPFAGNPVTVGNKTTYNFFSVTPSQVSITGPGTTVTQNLAETSAAAVNPFKALPPLEQVIRDSATVNAIAYGDIPFGGVNANGSFPTGSLEAIISNPGPANATGTVSVGAYRGWKYLWDASGTKASFVQPSTQEGGRHAMEIDTGISTLAYAVSFNNAAATTACPSSAKCYNYVAYYNPAGIGAVTAPIAPSGPGSGAILTQDGSFVAAGTTTFTIGVTRNEYSVGHQTAGSPLYTHQIGVTQSPGASIAFTNTWLNASGKTLGTYSGTRTVGTAPVLFTYSGSGTRTLYKADGSALTTINFSLANGQMNDDRSGGFAVTFTSGFSNATNNGTAVTWTLNAPGGTSLATGTVTNPNITGLQSANVATFTEDTSRNVTVTTDLNLGGNTVVFHL